MNDYCTTCLSRGRSLISVKDFKYVCILNHWLQANIDRHSGMLCWECQAIIIKIVKFHKQVEKAQELLISQQKNLVSSLSNLSNTYKTGYDISYDQDLRNDNNNDKNDSVLRVVKKEPITSMEVIIKPENTNDNISLKPTIHKSDYNIIHEDNESCDDDEDITLAKVKGETLAQHKLAIKDELELQEISSKNKLSTNQIGTARAESKLFSNNEYSHHETYFITLKMSEKEMWECRQQDRDRPRYKATKYKCEKCIMGYFSEDRIKQHFNIKHSERAGSHECPICSIRFKTKNRLSDHYDGHFRRYKCRDCEYNSHRLSNMFIHNRDQHAMKGKKYNCKICGSIFDSHGCWRYHKARFHIEREEVPQCKECGKTFATDNCLKIHIRRIHHDLDKTKCELCGKWFRHISKHMLTHNSSVADAQAFCAECGMQFKSIELYKRHLKYNSRHRNPDILMFKCPQCDLKFTTQFSCNKHTRIVHLKEYQFRCQLCDKGYSRRDRLQQHVMVQHEGKETPKTKVCNFCGKAFKDLQVLKKHIRIHTGERPYQCEYCSGCFNQRSAMKTHIKLVHLKQKKSIPKNTQIPQ